MVAALAQSFTGVGVTTSSSSFAITTGSVISVGSLLVLATLRGSPSGMNGVASIAGAGTNTWILHAAHSARASNHDLSLHVLPVTSQIAAGTVLTVNLVSASTRKVGFAAVFTGLLNSVDQTSGANTPGLFDASVGANGSGTAVSVSTPAVTANYTLVVAANAVNGGVDSTAGATEVGEVHTAVGTGDRGVMFQYNIVNAPGIKTMTATLPASGIWTAAALTLPIAGSPPATGGAVVIGGAKKTAGTWSVIVGGQKKTVSSASVIVGGVKRPLA